jgi:hypothetical protein
LDGRRTARRSISLPVIEVINFHSTPFYHTFPLATRLNGQKTAKMGKKVEKMRRNHSAAAPQSHKTLGKKTPESPKIPLQLGCSVTQIRHFFKRTFFNLPLIFENNVKKATVWLHILSVTCGDTSPKGRGFGRPGNFLLDAQGPIWRKRAGLACGDSGFWTTLLVKLLLA